MTFRGLMVLMLISAMGNAGCASRDQILVPATADPDVVALVDLGAVPTSFYVCHGYGCQDHTQIGLSKAEWGSIQAVFRISAPDPVTERRQIASAVALFENAVGQYTDTARDLPGTPFSLFDSSQLDCVDESINTSTYLNMLHRFGLLRWHRPSVPVRRGSPYTLNIHFSGALVENISGKRYVVDSWFYLNGKKPPIVPLEVWRAGWFPSQAKQTVGE